MWPETEQTCCHPLTGKQSLFELCPLLNHLDIHDAFIMLLMKIFIFIFFSLKTNVCTRKVSDRLYLWEASRTSRCLFMSPGILISNLIQPICPSLSFMIVYLRDTGCSLNIVFFPLSFVIFLNSASSAAALVFYLPGVCTVHTLTPRENREVRYILKLSQKHNI